MNHIGEIVAVRANNLIVRMINAAVSIEDTSLAKEVKVGLRRALEGVWIGDGPSSLRKSLEHGRCAGNAALDARVDIMCALHTSRAAGPASQVRTGIRRNYTPSSFDERNVIGRPPTMKMPEKPVLPPGPGPIAGMFGGRAAYEDKVREIEIEHSKAVAAYESAHADWNERVAQAKKRFAEAEARSEQAATSHSRWIEELESAYATGDRTDVARYLDRCLRFTPRPSWLTVLNFELVVTASGRAVVELELPAISMVPRVKEYVINRASEYEERPRSATETEAIYRRFLAALVLRLSRDLFALDFEHRVGEVIFNGMRAGVVPSTGKYERCCVLSLRIDRAQFSELVLDRVEALTCLQSLGCRVADVLTGEIQPVRPFFEYTAAASSEDMPDNVGPDLMRIEPRDFEDLISQLCTRMGLQTQVTQQTRDGGIDVVAVDPRPLVGGRTLIQAKRLMNAVGVSAIRDLYGTLVSEGANKGILITTSHFGSDSYRFAEGKPVELIDGDMLRKLLEEHGLP
jgi:restriction system protein